MSKTLDYIALIVVFIGAVNWGLIGLFRLDLVRLIFGDMTWISRIIYVLVGICGIYLLTLAWTLSMGTDIGGSATPIGASANVVGISVATKQGYPIGWGYYCKYAAPATIIVISISMVCIFLRYF